MDLDGIDLIHQMPLTPEIALTNLTKYPRNLDIIRLHLPTRKVTSTKWLVGDVDVWSEQRCPNRAPLSLNYKAYKAIHCDEF